MLPEACRWVFPAKHSGSFWKWGSAEDEAVREKAGVADLRAHDLRRTMATRIRALGFPRETVDAVLGHRESRLAQTCQVYDHLKEKASPYAVRRGTTGGHRLQMGSAPNRPARHRPLTAATMAPEVVWRPRCGRALWVACDVDGFVSILAAVVNALARLTGQTLPSLPLVTV